MPELKWTLNAQIVGGPVIAIAHSEEIDAYDKVVVALPPGGVAAAEHSVEVQPSAAGRIRMLLITSDLYGDELTFKASDSATDSTEVTLSGPQMYDAGAVALFNVDPQVLKLKNTHSSGDSTKEAHVEIIVGRNLA